MKLIYLGTELDANVEHELMATNVSDKFGFDVVIIDKDGHVETRNNCTEIHNLYENPFEPSIAFESDIHGTGGTRKIESINVVVIVKACEKSETY